MKSFNPKKATKKTINEIKKNNQLQKISVGTEKRLAQNTRSLRLINEKKQQHQMKVVAVIITLCTEGSYDQLFTTVQQKCLEGTKVEVYCCDSLCLEQLIDAFEGKPHDDVAIRLMDSVSKVDPDCVVLNWECCGGYFSKTFPEGANKLFYFLKKVIDRGHMAMFSDFSLMALVNEWKDKYELGPNPFVQTSHHTGDFMIKFKAADLKECPSAQLQTVGDMADKEMCHVMAAGGTIVYCVDSQKLNHNTYKLQVLTVVPNIQPPKPSLVSKIGDYAGSAGHVLLTYPSGGMILTSMGHWIQLMKIDTSAEKLFEVAEKEFGVQKAKQMRGKWQTMKQTEKKEFIASNAIDFVKNQAPCTNMNKKARKKL